MENTAPANFVQIGDFYIRESDSEGKVWIERGNGEGGDFPVKLLEAVIRDFYDAHF